MIIFVFPSKMSFSSLFVISGFYEDVYRVLISFRAGLSALVLPSTDSVQAGLPEQGLMEISADAGM